MKSGWRVVSISSPPETPLFMGISGLQVKSEEFQLIHGSAFRRSFVFDGKVNTSLRRFQIFPATFPLLFWNQGRNKGATGKSMGKKEEKQMHILAQSENKSYLCGETYFSLKSATYRVSWEFTCKTTKILLLYIFLGHNRNVVNTKSPYPIKRLEVIRRFNQKSMVFNQSLSWTGCHKHSCLNKCSIRAYVTS